MEMMRRLFPVFIMGFALTSLLLYRFGDSGTVPYKDLSDYRDRLAANVEDLTALNGKLTTELNGLKEDPETTAVLARDLGLYTETDRVIRLEGRNPPLVSYQAGNLLRLPKQKESANPFLKTAGLGLVGIVTALSLVLRGVSAKRRRHDTRGRKR
jgi:cell division protein FtsB